MLHQREMTDTIQVQDPHAGAGDSASAGGSPDAAPRSAPAMSHNIPVGVPIGVLGGGTGSAYGGGDGCQSIVQTAVSIVADDGHIVQSSSLPGTVLAVDVALSADGTSIAVASAGTRDPFAPTAGGLAFPGFGAEMKAAGVGGAPSTGFIPGTTSATATGMVALLSTSSTSFQEDNGDEGGNLAQPCAPANTIPMTGQPVAVAFTQDGTLAVQSREPAAITLVQPQGLVTIALGGESRLDTGHELFHRDAGAGIACASCHGEGGDDGHVWNFSDHGARRTQSINVGLEGTAPFHWAGDLKDLSTLMDTVFVGRMGGAPQSQARVDALSGWLFAQHPPARMRAADDAAALRGKALFESESVGCATCHNGEKFTNNETVDVGTGSLLQVPSLVGIAYRAPFIHTGCAPTLRDRFDPACGGGDKHGHTSDLSEDEIGDLIAYLETL
jgi:mono/diheme cytochrome c family protein